MMKICDRVLQGWQLPGIWAGMVLLVLCNAALDAALLLSKHSPIAAAEPLGGVKAVQGQHGDKHAGH